MFKMRDGLEPSSDSAAHGEESLRVSMFRVAVVWMSSAIGYTSCKKKHRLVSDRQAQL